MIRLFPDVPDRQLAVHSPYGQARLGGDHLRRNQIQILARAEVRVDILTAENREHHVAAGLAHARCRRDDSALVNTGGARTAFVIHLAAERDAGYVRAGLRRCCVRRIRRGLESAKPLRLR